MNRTSTCTVSSAAALILFAGSSLSAATLTNAPALPPVAPDLGGSLVRLVGSLGVVFAVLLGGVWLFRNWQRLVLRNTRPPELQILEARQLGQRHALYVIGYRDQRMLLAASPNGVNLLSHLPGGEAAPAPTAPPPSAPKEDFTSALQQALQARS
jgi:flagellar biogenesis protein FliO